MENITAYGFAIIAGGFTVLGALIGALVAYWLTTQIEDRKLSESARADFRAAFAPTIAFIYIARHHGTHDRPDIDTHIKNALLPPGAAVEEFRRFVGTDSGEGYQQAWEKYRKMAAIGHNARMAEEWGKDIHGYEILLECHIKSLLKFADA